MAQATHRVCDSNALAKCIESRDGWRCRYRYLGPEALSKGPLIEQSCVDTHLRIETRPISFVMFGFVRYH